MVNARETLYDVYTICHESPFVGVLGDPRVRKTLYGLYSVFFVTNYVEEWSRTVKGHFVTLIEVSIHLIECIFGLIRMKFLCDAFVETINKIMQL